MLDYELYANFVESLAQYPFANEGSIASVLYPTLGLTGEAAETLEKVILFNEDFSNEVLRKEVVKEVGDVLWYVTRVAAESSTNLKELVGGITVSSVQERVGIVSAAQSVVVFAGRVSERVKKAIRDDAGDIHAALTDSRRFAIHEDLEGLVVSLVQLSLALESSLEDVAVSNFEKLSSRDKRGLINGDGDNR